MEKFFCIPVHGIQSVGTAAVCLVATGGADAYYAMGIHCWALAGGTITVTEAGGMLMDVTGGSFDLRSLRVIAANNINRKDSQRNSGNDKHIKRCRTS
uniref:Lithium-sensitive myo-inositol monophosphatase A1 n=1 Tax=Piliocolobus tephrosceles TaxID=591936 RepID=A0A8C9IHJ0_9PRIM